MNFLPILFLLMCLSCFSQEDVIIPIDYTLYKKEFVPGLTQKKANEISARQDNEIRTKSIGKKLPEISVIDTLGSSVLLKKLVIQKTLIAIANAHCGFGLESLTNDLPKALAKIKEADKDLHVIILYERTAEDDDDSTRFNRNLSEIKELYPNVYIIDEIDSKKINVYGSPTRYYFNDKGILMEIKNGLSTVERLFDEITTVYNTL
ncbi:MAG: hypothetical protein HYU68_04670 [Bacteroidetes bacterium]|nr:hypothetical protein [Bacteroidota bacterium]